MAGVHAWQGAYVAGACLAVVHVGRGACMAGGHVLQWAFVFENNSLIMFLSHAKNCFNNK